MKQDSDIAQIPSWSIYGRVFSEFVLRSLFPTKIIDKSEALPKASKAAKEGKGLVIIFTHFSLRDAMEVNRSIIYKTPVIKEREVVNPLAFHQYNKFLELVGKFYHGTFAPIVNNSTITKKGYENLTRGKGLREFITLSSEVLNKGGVVTLAISATRKEKLYLDDPQKPIGYLIASLQSMKVKDYGLLLAGFEVKGAKSYSKKNVGGMNFGKTYLIRIGEYYTLENLLSKPSIGGKVSNVDAFVRKEMAKIVPKEYLSL